MHTARLLDMAADAAPDRLAFGGRACGLTFADARSQARAGAAWLTGHVAGTVVFVGLNGPALPVALFASSLHRSVSGRR
jgi:fatty-acyl-CoA synthase